MPEDQEGLARLSEILVFEKPLGGTAQDVVDVARRSVAHCDGVGIQVVGPDGVAARATTDSRSFDLDTLQDELDDGPCVESLRDGERHDLEPVTSDERWPRFAPSARRARRTSIPALVERRSAASMVKDQSAKAALSSSRAPRITESPTMKIAGRADPSTRPPRALVCTGTAGQLFQAKFPHLGDAAMHTHYWRLDADDIRYVHNDEGGNESFESLGQTWTREKVD